MMVNFIVFFVLTILYVVVIELDSYYYNSVWFKEKVPKEWYQIDVTKYFKDKKEK